MNVPSINIIHILINYASLLKEMNNHYRGLHNIYYAIFMLLFFSFKHV